MSLSRPGLLCPLESSSQAVLPSPQVGAVRLRQLRIKPNAGCSIGKAVQVHRACHSGGGLVIVKRLWHSYLHFLHAPLQESNTPTTGPTAGIPRSRSYVENCYPVWYWDLTRNTANYSVMADWPRSSPLTAPGSNRTDPTSVERAFSWQSAAALQAEGAQYTGLFGLYDGSGFVFDINNFTTSYLVDSFAFLKEHNWLDRQTRGLFMSMVMYNANYNLYAVMQFVFELSPAGVLVPLFSMSTIKMDMYVLTNLTPLDITKYIVEGILYLFLLVYFLNEFREVSERARSALTSPPSDGHPDPLRERSNDWRLPTRWEATLALGGSRARLRHYFRRVCGFLLAGV